MAVQCGYSNPIDLLEYVLRCQNWGDNATGTPSATALIRKGVGVSGSFDSITLSAVKAINIRYQIDSVGDSSTKDIIDKLCKQFSLIQYTDSEGYECVKYLFSEESDTTIFTIHIDDNLNELVEYQEPDISKICVNPFIKYNYDYALQEYTEELRITNVQTGTYNALYTTGFLNSEGEIYWKIIRDHVWPLVKHIEQMDSEWSENQFIIDYAGAKFRLSNIISIMRSGNIDFSLPFEIGYKYNAGDIIILDYPHLSWTGTEVKTCVIKSISKDKENNSCTISCFVRNIIMIEEGEIWQDNDDSGEIIQNNDDVGEAIKE